MVSRLAAADDMMSSGSFFQRRLAMSDSRYQGAMPDSLFKVLTKKQEREFRKWAHDNYSLTLPEGFSMFHPVIRDEWRKIENE